MELEFHQLDLRYEGLRVRQPARERRLLASLADAGQQMPIVVVMAGSTYVVVDGHKRVRCLRRLQRDTVAAVVWEMPEAEALIFRHLLHADATRELVLTDPWLVLRVTDDTPHAPVRPDASAPEALITDLHLLGAVARRAHRRLQHGGGLVPPERARAWRVFDQAQMDFHDL